MTQEHTWNEYLTNMLHDTQDVRFRHGQAIRSLNPGYLFGIADVVTCTDPMEIAYRRLNTEYRTIARMANGSQGSPRQQEFACVLEVRVRPGNNMRLIDPRDVEFTTEETSTEPIPF